MPDLAKRYRRLLFCYPRAYRHVRGDELVDTLLELAPPDRTQPTLREAANLIAQGLRCRLGRPDSRTVVTWSILTAVIAGFYGGRVVDTDAYLLPVVVSLPAAIGAWLLFGWSSRRTQHRGARRLPLLTSYFLAMLLWSYPLAWAGYHLLRSDWEHSEVSFSAYESRETWAILTDFVFVPFGGLLFAMALAIAALPQPREDATPIMS